MQKDIADSSLTIRVRHIYAAIVTIVSITIAGVSGWLSLKNDVANAESAFKSEVRSVQERALVLDNRISRIECLIEQQNRWLILKESPRYKC